MSLNVECPECATKYKVPDKLAGKRAKCKKCGATMSIPAPAADDAAGGDSLAALMDLAAESGAAPVAPSRGAGPRSTPGAPAGWTPESVIIEKESASAPRSRFMEGSGRWAPKSGGLGRAVRKVALLGVVVALVAGGWYGYTRYSSQAADLIASAKNKVAGDGKTARENRDSASVKPAAPTEAETQRADSAERLRRIFSAVNAHAARNSWNWPRELGALTQDGALEAAHLTSPFGPAFASADYVYKPFVPGMPAGPEVVLAYDAAELSSGDGAGVLFGSGEVRWLDKAGVEAALAQSEQLTASTTRERGPPLAARNQQSTAQPDGSAELFDGGDGATAGAPGGRAMPRRDVAERIKASAPGFVGDPVDVAVRRGTEQLLRAVTPASAVALLVRGSQGDTIEVFDGKATGPVEAAPFQSDPQFRDSPGAYALSPDGKLVARLTSFPKLRASIYSFEKKAESMSIDLDPKFGEPALVGFMGPDRLAVRWQKQGEYGLEVFDARTGRRARQLPLFRVDPPPAPGGEAVSPDGRTYALVNRSLPSNNARGAAAARGQGLQILLYETIGAATQPRRLQIPVLNNQPAIYPAGLAFSPDKGKLALLLVDNQKRAVVITWNMATGKPQPERVLTERIDRQRSGFGRARALDWVADGRGLLVAGRILLNPDTGDMLATLDAGKVHDQAVTDASTLHLAHGEYGQIEGLAIVPLNEAKFPEKPGLPNRAIAVPSR